MDFIYLIVFLIYSVIKDVENVLLKKIGINIFKGENILLTSEEPSLLQCAHRCRFIDKNAVVDFKNMICNCFKYENDEGQDQNGFLTEVFINQGVMKKIEPPKTTKVINVATRKVTQQSTLFDTKYKASNGVDDNLNTQTITHYLDNQWWSVDLEKIYEIMYIILVKSGTGNDRNRALIADTSQEENGQWILCKTIGNIDTKYNFNFTCDNPTNARYVRLRSTANCYLNFYEIQVFARVPV